MILTYCVFARTGAHSSRTDTRPHYTVDLYRKARPELGIMTDQPIGVVHVYKEDDTEKEEDCTVFENPRTKAKAVSLVCY